MKNVVAIALVILCCCMSGFHLEAEAPSLVYEEPVVIVCVEKSYSQRVFETCLINGLDTLTSQLLVAQAKLESASFTSKLFRKHNNAFGLMFQKTRCGFKSLAENGQGFAEGRLGYSTYYTIEDSTQDVIFFLMCKGTLQFNNPTHYVDWLKSIHYFEADKQVYLNAIRTHLKKVKLEL